MLRSLNTGISGLKQFQTALDNIGNNLANLNTVGFKSSRVDFADTLNQTLRPGTPDSGGARTGTASIQVGNGVFVSGVRNQFTQGAVNQTGVFTDLAISGEGFFVVKNPANTTELFATRAGDFRIDSNGFLVTNQGFRVQGIVDTIDAGLDFAAGAVRGDILLNKGNLPALAAAVPTAGAAGISNITIDSSGKIQVLLEDGTQYIRGQILLQKFQNPNALLKGGNNLYSGMATAGAITPLADVGVVPNTQGTGHI